MNNNKVDWPRKADGTFFIDSSYKDFKMVTSQSNRPTTTTGSLKKK